MSAFRVLVLVALAAALLPGPAGLRAQRKEDFLQIQRDVAQLQDQVKQLQRSQDDKIAALETLLRQALDASNALSTSLSTLQTSLTTTLSEQQRGVVAPMAALSKQVEQISDEFGSIRSNMTELGAQIGRLDGKLADISSAIRTLQAPPVAPPPPISAAPPDPVPPPGVTPDSLFENARRDYLAKRDDLAMQEFNDYLKYFPQTENAPRAQYHVGMIYDRAEQFDDAAKAFDAVLERFQPNPFTPEAHYMKGVVLMKAKRRTEAASEFQDFLRLYPTSDNAPKARQHLRELGVPATGAKPRGR
jgi:TolA-binding protein